MHRIATHVLRRVVLAICALGISACTSPAAPNAGSTPVANAHACDIRDLAVTVDAALAVHVRNRGGAACRLNGTPAVEMKVGRVEGQIPTTDVVVNAGSEFVQPHIRVEGATACPAPMSAGLPRPGLWTIVVQNQTVHPSTSDGQLVAQVVNCWVVTMPQGRLSAS
jgi:hypothetical protein